MLDDIGLVMMEKKSKNHQELSLSTSSIISDYDTAIRFHGDGNHTTVAGQRFVHGVINDLEY